MGALILTFLSWEAARQKEAQGSRQTDKERGQRAENKHETQKAAIHENIRRLNEQVEFSTVYKEQNH